LCKALYDCNEDLNYTKAVFKKLAHKLCVIHKDYGMGPYEKRDWVETVAIRLANLTTALKALRRRCKTKTPQWVLDNMPWLAPDGLLVVYDDGEEEEEDEGEEAEEEDTNMDEPPNAPDGHGDDGDDAKPTDSKKHIKKEPTESKQIKKEPTENEKPSSSAGGEPPPKRPKQEETANSERVQEKFVIGFCREHNMAWRVPYKDAIAGGGNATLKREFCQSLGFDFPANAQENDHPVASWADGYKCSVKDLTCHELEQMQDKKSRGKHRGSDESCGQSHGDFVHAETKHKIQILSKRDRAMIMCVIEQRKQVMMVPYQAFMQGVPKESITLELELTYQEEALKFVKDIVKDFVVGKIETYCLRQKCNTNFC
jgi:hypothetical protein